MPRLTRKAMAESADTSAPSRRSARASTLASSLSTRAVTESPTGSRRSRSARGRAEKPDPEDLMDEGEKEEEEEEEEEEETPKKTRGGRGRQSRGGAGGRKGRSTSRTPRGKQAEEKEEEEEEKAEEEEEEEEEEVTPKGRRARARATPTSTETKPRGRGRSRRGRQTEAEEDEEKAVEAKPEEAAEEEKMEESEEKAEEEKVETPPAGRGRRGGRGKAAAAAASTPQDTPPSAGRVGRRGRKAEPEPAPAPAKAPTPRGRRSRRGGDLENEEEAPPAADKEAKTQDDAVKAEEEPPPKGKEAAEEPMETEESAPAPASKEEPQPPAKEAKAVSEEPKAPKAPMPEVQKEAPKPRAEEAKPPVERNLQTPAAVSEKLQQKQEPPAVKAKIAPEPTAVKPVPEPAKPKPEPAPAEPKPAPEPAPAEPEPAPEPAPVEPEPAPEPAPVEPEPEPEPAVEVEQKSKPVAEAMEHKPEPALAEKEKEEPVLAEEQKEPLLTREEPMEVPETDLPQAGVKRRLEEEEVQEEEHSCKRAKLNNLEELKAQPASVEAGPPTLVATVTPSAAPKEAPVPMESLKPVAEPSAVSPSKTDASLPAALPLIPLQPALPVATSSPPKPQPLPSAELSSSPSIVPQVQSLPSTVPPAEEDPAKDFVLVSKEEVPPADSQELQSALLRMVPPPKGQEAPPAAPASLAPTTVPAAATEQALPSDAKSSAPPPRSTEAMEVDQDGVAGSAKAPPLSGGPPPQGHILSQPAPKSPTDPGNPVHSGTESLHSNNVSSLSLSKDPSQLPLPNEIPLPPSQPAPPGDPLFTRRFVPNSALNPVSVDPAKTFSLVSYNVLANCHVRPERYPYADASHLDQQHRHRRLMEELRHLDADIVCLQEVGPDYYNQHLLPDMKSLGFDGTMMRRTKDYFNEGEATFYRAVRFELVEAKGLSLTELAYREMEVGGLRGETKQVAQKYLDRADVVLITRLRCRNSGNIVTVGNIHLVWDHFRCPDVQCVQVASAIKEVVNRAGSDSSPHILCGDFNSEAGSPPYQLACDGYLADSSIRKLQTVENIALPDGSKKSLMNVFWRAFQHTSTNLKSAYFFTKGSEPEVTSFTSFMEAAVDYILFNATSLKCLGVLDTVSKTVVLATKGLPNTIFPSDHLSMKAAFAFEY